MNDWHIGRNWVAPDPCAPACGCAVLPCGLVSQEDANAKWCEHHSFLAGRTIRASHKAEYCSVLSPESEGKK